MKTHAFVRSNIPRAIQNGQAKLSQIKTKLNNCQKENKSSDSEGNPKYLFFHFLLIFTFFNEILRNRINESSFKNKKSIARLVDELRLNNKSR
jgi:hypothetical protein